MSIQPATVDQLILQQLEAADLPSEVGNLILAALLGHDELQKALGGTPSNQPRPTAAAAAPSEPAGAYVNGIEVRGFRGIGETATLELVPGPGLTVVVGRNGSGKSSFAEAAELALTDQNQRWTDRTQVWKDGWRNLHTTGERYLRLRLSIDGHRGGAVVETRWTGDGLDERETFLQLAGQRRGAVSELGWEQDLELYRPFLSYAELGGMLNGTRLHDSLHSVLGLGRQTELESILKGARSQTEKTRKQAKNQLPALQELLGAHSDQRARAAEKLLENGAVKVDLDQLEKLATFDDLVSDDRLARLRALHSLTVPARETIKEAVAELAAALGEIDELADTPAAEAASLASLLQAALQHRQQHPDQPCPVCQGRALDGHWATETQAQVDRLTAQAHRLEQAHSRCEVAMAQLLRLLPHTPQVLLAAPAAEDPDHTLLQQAWQRYDRLRDGQAQQLVTELTVRYDELVTALGPVRQEASALLEGRHQAWQPVAEALRDWVATARRSQQAAKMNGPLRKAVEWLVGKGKRIRNDRLAPLATQAGDIWRQLRQDSNVHLEDVALEGTGNQRKADIKVAVDGVESAALGVMSQGELHALALSLFLPRATMPDSPFKFLVIDDPVQSMDPAKVAGLAKVLEQVANDRQVIVFTHDDRLPTAIRYLGIEAHLRVVSRREQSQVTVETPKSGDPALRYLADAWAVARDEKVSGPLQSKTVAVLVRQGIEARCHDLILARALHNGRPLADIESQLGGLTRVRAKLALALFDDAGKEGELHAKLKRLHHRGPQTVAAANKGAHDDQMSGPLTALVIDAQELINQLGKQR